MPILSLILLIALCEAPLKGGLEGSGWPVPLLTFGLIADPHANVKHRQPWWCDLACWKKEVKLAASSKGRKHGGVMKKLKESVDVLSRIPGITFSVDLGDLCDMDMMVNMPLVLDVWDKLPHPHHNVMGNHDLRGENDRFGEPAKLRNKTQISWLLKQWKLKSDTFYYAFSYDPFRFIVLDSMTLPPTAGSSALKDAQVKWLDEQLQQASTAKQDVIVFAHIPIGLATNPIRHTLLKYSNILAVFHGHKHSGDYYHNPETGKHMITLQGMIETNINAFAYVNLFLDRIELVGFGRVPSRVYFRSKPQLQTALERPMSAYTKLLTAYKGVGVYDQKVVERMLSAKVVGDVFQPPFKHPADLSQKAFTPLEAQSSISYIMAKFKPQGVGQEPAHDPDDEQRQAVVQHTSIRVTPAPVAEHVAAKPTRSYEPQPQPDFAHAAAFLTLLMVTSGIAGVAYLTRSFRGRMFKTRR